MRPLIFIARWLDRFGRVDVAFKILGSSAMTGGIATVWAFLSHARGYELFVTFLWAFIGGCLLPSALRELRKLLPRVPPPIRIDECSVDLHLGEKTRVIIRSTVLTRSVTLRMVNKIGLLEYRHSVASGPGPVPGQVVMTKVDAAPKDKYQWRVMAGNMVDALLQVSDYSPSQKFKRGPLPIEVYSTNLLSQATLDEINNQRSLVAVAGRWFYGNEPGAFIEFSAVVTGSERVMWPGIRGVDALPDNQETGFA